MKNLYKYAFLTIKPIAITLLVIVMIISLDNYQKKIEVRFRTIEQYNNLSAPPNYNPQEPPQNHTVYFTADHNYLGQIAFRYATNGVVPGHINFSIQEVNQELYFHTTIPTDTISNDVPYPIGFPPISNSQGKTYQINIHINSEDPEKKIILSYKQPNIIARYDLPLNIDSAKIIIPTKIKNFLDNQVEGKKIVGLLAPLVAVILLPITNKLYPQYNAIPLIALLAYDIAAIANYNETTYAAVVILWCLYICTRKKIISITFITTFALFISIPITLTYSKNEYLQIKTSVYSYLFLIISMYQQIIATDSFTIFKKLNLEGTFINKILKQNPNSDTELILTIIKSLAQKIYKYKNLSIFILIYFIVKKIYQSGSELENAKKIYYVFYLQEKNTIFYYRILLPFMFTWLISGLASLWIIKKAQQKYILLSTLIVLCITILTTQICSRIITYSTAFRNNVYIRDITPPQVTLWDKLTIDGANFGELPWQGTVKINNIEHRIISWKDNEIKVQIEPGKTQSGPIIVTTYQGKQSNSLELTVY